MKIFHVVFLFVRLYKETGADKSLTLVILSTAYNILTVADQAAGGRAKWNLCGRLRRPSFNDQILIFKGQRASQFTQSLNPLLNQVKQTAYELICVLPGAQDFSGKVGLSEGNQQISDLLTNCLLAVRQQLPCHSALSSFQESILTFAFQHRFLKG